MKFYRMKNGDIVTDLHISTRRAHALKGTRMFDAGNKTLCCDSRIYYDGVEERLNSAQTIVLLKQISATLKGGAFRAALEEKPWYTDLKDRALGLLP